MTRIKQEFHGSIDGDVSGRDIINEAPTVVNHWGANYGGTQQVINAAAPIYIHVARENQPVVKVVVPTGPEHITEEQRLKLKALVDEVVRLEKLVKRAPKHYGAVWKAVCGKVRASQMKLILVENYSKAEQFLREWIGRLSSTKSAPKKDPEWRKRRYAYIFTNIKQLGAGEQLNRHLQAKFGAASLKDLPDDDLSTVYQTVASWKRAKA